jgi:hypothetical protein
MFLAAAAYFIKAAVQFNPSISLIISGLLAIVFFLAVLAMPNSRFKLILVGLAIAVDAIALFGLMDVIPIELLKEMLIMIHVFIWPIISLFLFFIGFEEMLASGASPSKFSWIIVISLIGFAVYILLSGIVGSDFILYNSFLTPLSYQQETYQGYLKASKGIAEYVQKTFEETKTTTGDQVGCVFQSISQPGKVEQEKCLLQKRAERYCAEIHGDDAIAKSKCVDEKMLGDAPVQARKITTRDPTSIELAFDSEQKVYYSFGGEEAEGVVFPLVISYKNPLEKEIKIAVKCNFTGKGSNKGKEVAGVVNSKGEGEEIVLSNKQGKTSVSCSPSETLEGSYELEFKVEARELSTESTIIRFFVSSVLSEEEEAAVLQKILNAETGSTYGGKEVISYTLSEELKKKFAASSVAGDLVELRLGLGSPTVSDAVIKGAENLRLAYYLKDNGKGRLVRIKSYGIEMEGLSASCKENAREMNFPEKLKEKEMAVGSCLVDSLPSELEEPSVDYVKKEIRGEMVYDYELIKKKDIEVKKMASGQ